MADELVPPDEGALVPVRQQTVEFYGDTLLAAEGPDATIWVPVRPICEAIGLDWPSQYQRLKRDPVLRVRQGVVIITTPGGEQPAVALPLKLLPGWLFGIQASRVKPELREKILRYQEDCYEVLWTAFKADILPSAPALSNLTDAQQTLELITAMQRMAQQQVDLEQHVVTLAERQQVMADYTRGFIQQTRTHQAHTDDRLAAIELRLDPTAVITEEQAAELALAVKNVGQRLAAQGEKTGYARVYSEMYRRYRVSSYKNLPRTHYDEVLAWLYGWYEELANPT